MDVICYPRDDMEQVFIIAALEAAEIPHFIMGQYFGGLYPGIQIPGYNERSIQVPAPYFEEAAVIISDIRSRYISPAQSLSAKSKLRMLFEALLIGWAMPGGKKSPRK